MFMYAVALSHEGIKQTACARLRKDSRKGGVAGDLPFDLLSLKAIAEGGPLAKGL